MALLLALLVRGELSAQVRVPVDTAKPARFALTGVVYDSIAAKALKGAIVQLVSVRHPERIASFRTDSAGRFQVAALDSGSYLLAASHPRLDSLLLRPIERALVIESAASTQIVQLATPSWKTLELMFCAGEDVQLGISPPPRGLMLGHLRRHDRLPIGPNSAGVRARWRHLDVSSEGLRTRLDSVNARVDAPRGETTAAAFVLCGLPADQLITLQAWFGPDSTALLELDVPSSGVLLRDLVVPIWREKSSRQRSTSGASAEPMRVPLGRVTGYVRDSSGAGVVNGEVLVVGFDLSARSDSTGAFTLRDIPSGTQSLLVRALGFTPLRLFVDVMSEPADPIEIRMLRPPPRLSVMTIRERRSFAGFEIRRKRGAGVFIDEETILRRKPWVVGDLLTFVPGVRVRPDSAFGKRFETRFGRRSCEPTVYVNGREMFNKSRDLDAYVDVKKIRAVEVYSVPGEVPAEFLANLLCGAVVIWTHP